MANTQMYHWHYVEWCGSIEEAHIACRHAFQLRFGMILIHIRLTKISKRNIVMFPKCKYITAAVSYIKHCMRVIANTQLSAMWLASVNNIRCYILLIQLLFTSLLKTVCKYANTIKGICEYIKIDFYPRIHKAIYANQVKLVLKFSDILFNNTWKVIHGYTKNNIGLRICWIWSTDTQILIIEFLFWLFTSSPIAIREFMNTRIFIFEYADMWICDMRVQ